MSYLFSHKNAKHTAILLACLSLLILIFSVQAQDTPSTDIPTDTPATNETPAVEPLATEIVTMAPTDVTAIPTQDVIPLPTEITPVPIEPTQEIGPLPTQELVPLPTEETTAVATSEASPVETVTPVATETSLPLAFSANFDTDYPTELSANTGWIDVIVDNGKALQSNPASVPVAYTVATFSDAAVEAKFLLNTGEGQVLLGGYTAGLNVDGTVTLYRDQQAILSSVTPLVANEWSTLKLQIVGAEIQVSVNGAILIDYTETVLLPAGVAGFAASNEAVLRVDDFAVYGVGVPTALSPIVTEIAEERAAPAMSMALPMLLSPLNVPTNVILAANGTGVDVAWDDTNLEETGYEIERYVSDALSNDPNYSVIGTTLANVGVFTEANVGCGLTLWYRVRAVRSSDSAVSDWSAWISVTTDPCTATCNSADTVRRVSVGTNSTYQTSGVLTASGRALSSEGYDVVFGSSNPLESPASELSAENNLPGIADVYNHRTACVTSKASIADGGGESAQAAYPGAQGPERVIFDSTDPNLTSNDGSSLSSVFINLETSTQLMSTQLPGNVKAIDFEWPFALMSTDGDLTSLFGVSDTNNTTDLVVYDYFSHTLQLVTFDYSGANTANDQSFGGRVIFASDGTVYVLFNSYASNLISEADTNTNCTYKGTDTKCSDVFLRKVSSGSGVTTRISLSDTEGQLNSTSVVGGFSLVGSTLKVAFETMSRETGIAGGPTRVLLRTVDLSTYIAAPSLSTTTLVSRATGAAGTIALTSSYGGKLSREGRWVVFSTADANMVSGDTNGVSDVFVRDLTTNITQRVSLSNLGAQLTRPSTAVDINLKGDKILFSSADSTIVTNDTANVCETDFANDSTVAGMQYDYNDNCVDLFVATNPLAYSATPTNLKASTTYSDKIRLSWSAVSDVQGFVIEESSNGGVGWSTLATTNDGAATWYDVTSVCSGSQRLFRMRSTATTAYFLSLTSAPTASVTGKTTICAGPILQSPANKAFLNINTQPLSWSKPDPEIYEYDVDLSTSATFATHVSGWPQTTPTEGSNTGPLADGTYYWRVRTSAPGIGTYSATSSFTIDTVAPAAPVILTPENLAVLNSPVTFTWGAVTGAKRYTLILNDGSNDDINVESLTTPTYSPGLDVPQGQYTLTVAAIDAAENVSAQSSITFTLNPMLTPANNTVVTATGGTANVTFTWKGVGVSGAHLYTAQLYSDASLSTQVDFCQSSTVFTCTISNVAEGVYYWRVLRDAESTGIGTPVSNKLYVSQALPAPTLLSPANNGFVTPDQRSGGVVTLAWNWGTVLTPDGGPFTYEIEVNTSSTFAIEPVFSTSIVIDQTALTNSILDGTYYWRIRATNSLGAVSAWSPTYKFVLDTLSPTAPNLVTPAESALIQTARPALTWTGPTDAYRYEVTVKSACSDNTFFYTSGATIAVKTFTIPNPVSQGTQQVCVQAYDRNMNPSSVSARTINVFLGKTPADKAFVPAATRPTFTWAATTGTTSLALEYDTDSNFSNPTSIIVSGISKTLDATLPAGIYYWRVRRVGEVFIGNPYRTLYVGALLAAPTSPLPVTGTTYSANASSVDLTWTDSDPAPIANLDVTDYQIVISKSALFTPALVTTSVAEGTQTYPWTLPAQQNRVTYYWHVRALSNGLPVSNWSATRSFIVDNFTPVMPTITAPVTNALLNTVRPTFAWGAVAGATGYRVSITDITASADLVSDVTVTTLAFTPTVNLTQNTLKFTVTAVHNLNDSSPAEVTFTVSLGTTPANNTAITTTKPVFTWTAAPGTAVKYTLEVANNLAFSSPVFSQSNIALASYTPTDAQATALTTAGAGVYYWRVTHTGVNGTSISTARAFTYIATGKPTNLEAHVNGIAGTVDAEKLFNNTEDEPIGLTWDAPATSVTPIGYVVEIANNATFTIGLKTLPQVSTTSTTVSEGTLSDGLKYWRVKAFYSGGFTSTIYSAASTFTLDTTPPAAPTTSEGNFITKTTVQPTFTWNSSGTGVTYHLTLMSIAGFEDVVVTGTSYTVPSTTALMQRSPSGVYVWSLRVADAAGNLSDAVTRYFRVRLGTSPSAGQFITDTTPTFTWTSVTGTAAATAQVQIATDSLMTNIIYTSPDLTEPVSEFTLPDANALAGIYYWRVLRSGETTGMTQGFKFIVIDSPALLVAPVITGPAANVTLGTSQLQANPFTWNAVQPTTGFPFISYSVYIYKVSPIGSLTPYHDSGVATTSFGSFLTSFPDGTYAWRVLARLSSDGIYSVDGPLSGYHKFTIDNTPPSIPVMSLPVSKAVMTTTRRPTFTWAASTGGAVKYMVQIRSTDPYTTVQYTTTVTTTTLTLPPSQALPNGNYYWRVTAVDALGNTINTSNRVFRIAVP